MVRNTLENISRGNLMTKEGLNGLMVPTIGVNSKGIARKDGEYISGLMDTDSSANLRIINCKAMEYAGRQMELYITDSGKRANKMDMAI